MVNQNENGTFNITTPDVTKLTGKVSKIKEGKDKDGNPIQVGGKVKVLYYAKLPSFAIVDGHLVNFTVMASIPNK